LIQIFVTCDIKCKFDIKLDYKVSMCKGGKYKHSSDKVMIDVELRAY